MIAGPGFLGFRGGVFNPGAIRTGERGILLVAKGQRQHWIDAAPANYMRGSPIVFSLEPTLRVATVDTISNLIGFPAGGDIEIEDFRLFPFGGEIWVNHGLIEVIRTGGDTGYRGSRIGISRLDAVKKELTFLGCPQIDFQARPREKNWVFVELAGQLYLLYSFDPYRVLRLSDRRNLVFATAINRGLGIDFRDLGGFAAPISYSTNPIHYDDDHFFVLLHQSVHRAGGRSYFHWGALLDKDTLYPKKVSSRPLLTGMGARGLLRGILYIASVVRIGNDFVFFSGEGDSYVTRATVPKARLDGLWTRVPEKSE